MTARPATIDRETPTRRPETPCCGVQRWNSLLFLHWSVPTESLRPLVPSSLELDFFEGETFVGLVPFRMDHVQPWTWWPSSLAFRFLETNVRVYVHHQGRPGVYFLSLEASSWLAVQAARTLWGLPYHYARMSYIESDGWSTCESRRRGDPAAASSVRFRAGQALGASHSESREFFFLERYLLFVERRGKLFEGQVHHSPYPAQDCEVERCDDSLIAAGGLPQPQRPPDFAHYSPGVEVEIYPLRPV